MSDLSVQSAGNAAFSQTAQTASTKGTNAMDMNSFLTMFTTQLKYQDPTNPLESYELAAQLAQFSSVEKLSSLDNKLSEMESYMAAMNNSQMIQAIGKEVTGTSNTIQVNDSGISKTSFQLGSDVAKTTVQILSASGEVVKTLSLGGLSSGEHSLNWDGTSDAGKKMPSGAYTFEITALKSDGTAADVDTSITGTAHAFRMVNGVPYLVLNNDNGILLPTSAVKQIKNTSA
jgi:flagellar basal-body rod modification protein FlgD